MRRILIGTLGIALMACMATGETKINKSIHVANGETHKGKLSTVNGAVVIGARAIVKGDASTVNGSIEVGKEAKVGDVSSVNGSIAIGQEAEVDEVTVVNGKIHIERGAKIAGEVSTVNGEITSSAGVIILADVSTVNGGIELDNTKVREDVATVNGDISLFNASVVEQNIIIDREHKGNWKNKMKELTIRIDGDSYVKGDIEVKGEDPMVTVVLSNGGKVGGEVINAKLVKK